MKTKPSIYAGLAQLGKKTPIPSSPEKAKLEKVQNPNPQVDYAVRFTCPEFTSLCPITGQPDFALLVIDYVPGKFLLESKSLKLFLTSYRNHGAFHEECTVEIARRIEKEIQPKWLRMGGYWNARGGIPIDILYQSGKAPKDMWLPEQQVTSYQGRSLK